MKYKWMLPTVLSMVLCSCGGSDENTTAKTPDQDSIETLSNTSWRKPCSPYNKFSSDELATSWNVKISLTIDSSLQARYKTEYFQPTDTTCNKLMFDTLEISILEIKNKVFTEESIEAYGLNETFIYLSENTVAPPKYSLIYVASEKLYFGQKSEPNLGSTPETRLSSISLDHYFNQIIN